MMERHQSQLRTLVLPWHAATPFSLHLQETEVKNTENNNVTQ